MKTRGMKQVDTGNFTAAQLKQARLEYREQRSLSVLSHEEFDRKATYYAHEAADGEAIEPHHFVSAAYELSSETRKAVA